MSRKKSYFLLILLIIILTLDGFLIGLYFGAHYLKNNTSLSSNDKVDLVPPLPQETYGLSGTINSLNEESLTLINQDQTIKYNSQTEFFKINNNPDSAPPTPDSANNSEAISVNDLKSGDLISVTAAEDIKNQSEFIATKITLIINQ